ncbi:hypothetical protein B0A70_01400 [Chryseobacterium piscicola]|uniref:Uncharacterized protein n=1 Tax=Chryseobacterium piscicola TaxID=551459 RepID=A0A2S7KI40_9FLAO|nr:hypothetical protein B0A70_01400 [Chryseobacterium piscicola]
MLIGIGTNNLQAQDSDGDGIANTVDLDDDNDGILDVTEGVVDNDNILEWGYNWTGDAPSIFNSTVISAAQNATKGSGLTAQIFGGETSYSVTGVSATTISQSISNNSYFQFKFTTANFPNTMQYLYDRFSLWVRDASVYPTYKMRLYLSTDNFATSTDISGEVAYPNVTYDQRAVFPLVSPYNLTPNKTYTLRLYFYDVSGGASATFNHDDFQVLTTQYADTDGDGIPNHLDLDSDNDGCLDALEGDENVTTSQLQTASGTVTVGTSAASNQNLGVAVNANGVPALVNSGGAADIGSDQGQGVGTSTNSSIKDVQCSSVFGCTSWIYLSQYNTLYNVDTSTNPFTYPSMGTASVNYNAIAINPLDGRMYGMQVLNSNNLLVINTDGSSVNLGPVTGLPANVTYNAGEIDNAGNYYVKVNNDNQQLYKINLSTQTATLITLNASIFVPDMAFNIKNGLLYGVNATNGQLVSINPTTLPFGTVTPIGTAPGSFSFGAMFASSTGEIYGVDNNNGGGFYQFNLTTGQKVKISGAPESSGNDGAHCVTAPIVFSADLAITKDDGKANYSAGTTNTYTVVVSNNDGPFGVLGAKVSDPVPAGIPAGNVSYSVPVVTGGATTSITSAQTGALNDVVNIPKGGTITYTITIAVPISYSGDLVNVATVTSPANSTDPVPTNNTDTDTDSSVCYKPAVVDAGNTYPTKHGITALGRAGADNENWPMVRQSAWTVLESKEKGFVVNRVNNTADLVNITNPVEGMMVYDNQAHCLKIYTLKSGDTLMGWHCFTTPACPD